MHSIDARTLAAWFNAHGADEAVCFLNSHPSRNPIRRVRQPDDAPMNFGGWFFTVHPFDDLKLFFVEARISNVSRFIGCPNPPDAYLIVNGGKVTRFHDRAYGRAVRIFGALVAKKGLA